MNALQVQIPRFSPLGVVWLALASVTVPVTSMGILTNFTIDDSSTRFQYLPEASWTLGSTPFLRLDPLQLSAGTWHGATGNPQDTSPREIHLNFTAVYVFCVIANQLPRAPKKPFDTFAAYKFLIDDVVVGEFRHEAEDTTEYFYNTPVYVNTSLPNKDHRFTMRLDSVDRPALMLFDHLVYSTMSSPSATPSVSFPSLGTDVFSIADDIFSVVTSIISEVVSKVRNGVTPSAPMTPSATSSLPTSQHPASPTSSQLALTTYTSSASITPTITPTYITSSSQPSPSLGSGSDKNIAPETGKSDDTVAIVGGTLGSVVFFILATIIVLLMRRTLATKDPLQVWRPWRRYGHFMSLPLLNRLSVHPLDPEDPTTPIGLPPISVQAEVLGQQRGAHPSVPALILPATRDLDQSLVVAPNDVNQPSPPATMAPYNIDTNDWLSDYGLPDEPLPEYVP
ncbi:hypothetical protein CCMSSC00406_0006769 [Pleurotus cornucopiae]|uniref:Uncharacterized protein n=1 Tax=Pleurotus cornucopiae TaxID=5321 RepID=A0ACB7J2F4_PLECO|nr:hypothetical protein CCMSSC00406_0006769 [Pleurotus cornucopiae]